MPEGPEILRACDELAGVLKNQKVRQITFAFDELKGFQSRFRNKNIVSVTARGKAILIGLSNGYTIYSHNQLYGRWIVKPAGIYPETKRQLRMEINVNDYSALLYSASDIEVLNKKELKNHAYLNRLGLELLSPKTTEQVVLERLSEKRFSRRCLMGLLQDQSVLAGMGNYLCCEVLHIVGLHPENRIIDLNMRELKKLAGICLKLTRQSYKTGGITNLLSRAKKLKKQGLEFEDYRFYVYRRAGQDCYQCGNAIIKDSFCGRMGYVCPDCQQ
ncbi:MAG: endonuclease VIII [Gammaproteobacteria bacterium]|nr:endonuclease VIII [Gammaproteobacteria bacterium]MDH5593219.1 endonuclease VIII [Gammaproteobacteria bacterium]MDH5613875.1 endonuclease VIII [Gammaproteobacteria bacterium]